MSQGELNATAITQPRFMVRTEKGLEAKENWVRILNEEETVKQGMNMR